MQNVTARISPAPYRDEAIRLSLTSSTTSAYRPLHCLECGKKFIEREGAYYWRTNTDAAPSPIRVDAYGVVITNCANCHQQYAVTFSLTTSRVIVPLYQQAQSIYFIPVARKVARLTKCMECGKGLQHISDRISMVVDNVTPVEFQDPLRLAPFQADCEFTRCRQRWALMV